MELNNINESKNIIEAIESGSIAEELELELGDILVSINGKKVKDIIDYKYLMADEYIVVEIEKQNGEMWELEIEKDFDEDIGIVFTNPLIDSAKSCRNKCIFCFIDQLPKGMRETVYFKDDDSRLSFLQGNFITLTNMSEEEINRIIKYKLGPINISVHTTDPELRVKMLNNKNAGKVYEILKRLDKAGIQMNCQIVLVPEVNDGKNLKKTLNDLIELYPNVRSTAVVPIGITKFRDGLHRVKPYTYESANEVLSLVEDMQKRYLDSKRTRFVFASDEFYLLSKKEIPKYDDYEGFPQIENGVGLIKQFENEIQVELGKISENKKLYKRYIIATGTLAFSFMSKIANDIMNKFEGLHIEVVPIKNYFFGEYITVSGLITGSDLVNQLSTYSTYDGIIIPKSMLKSDEDIFLDDMTIMDIESQLKTQVIVSEVDGKEFVNAFREI